MSSHLWQKAKRDGVRGFYVFKKQLQSRVLPLQGSVFAAECRGYQFIMAKAQKEPMKHKHGCTNPLGPDLCAYRCVFMCPYIHVCVRVCMCVTMCAHVPLVPGNAFTLETFLSFSFLQGLFSILVEEASIFLFAWRCFSPHGMFLQTFVNESLAMNIFPDPFELKVDRKDSKSLQQIPLKKYEILDMIQALPTHSPYTQPCT